LSDRVCYIRRADRGGILQALRMLSAHSDEQWVAGASVDTSLISQSVDEGAQWIRDRLEAADQSRQLSMLCLDPDGAVCSWVKPEDADPTLLDAAITNSDDEIDHDALEAVVHSGLSERFPKLPLELSYELLDPDETSSGSRSAVMALPDVPGRLLKDQLDAMGIRVEKFTTIWHAIASVWDPGAGQSVTSAQRIVASDAPIVAVIVVDPVDGRLIWTWSRQGKLITAGTQRITMAHQEHDRVPMIRNEHIARLSSDWLSWSSQLGVAPSRVLFVGKPAQIKELDALGSETGEQGSSESPTTADSGSNNLAGLSAGEIGSAISRSWPDATIDLLEHDDPVGETLSKIATKQRGQDLFTLTNLGNRPTRVHRSMYRWAGMALTMVAIMISIVAYQFLTQADEIRDRTRDIDARKMELITDYDPELARSSYITFDLQKKLEQLRNSGRPLRITQSKPILEELETLSYVFGIPGIEINNIKLTNTAVIVTARVENLILAEQLDQGLESIKGLHLRWNTPNFKSITSGEQKIEATYTGQWISEEIDS
jgi:hypothetical protein